MTMAFHFNIKNKHQLIGSTARLEATMIALRQVVCDFVPRADEEYSTALKASIDPMIQHLVDSRPVCAKFLSFFFSFSSS